MRNSSERGSPSTTCVDCSYTRTLARIAFADEQLLPSRGSKTIIRDALAQHDRPELDIELYGNQLVPRPREIYTILDPFIVLPKEVTDYERSQLQIYLAQGNTWFGMSNDSRYSSTHVTGLTNAIHSALGRQWICILINETLHAANGGKTPTRALLSQNRSGYHHLNEALRARNTRFEEAVLALVVIGLHVLFFGDERSRNLHATATDMLLHSRGSIAAALRAMPHTEPWYVTGQLAIGKCRFRSREHLNSVKDSWRSDLLRILQSPRRPWALKNTPWIGMHYPEDSGQLQERVTRLVIQIADPSSSQCARGSQLIILLEQALTILHLGYAPELLMSCYQRMDFLTSNMLMGGGSGYETYDLRTSIIGPALSCARREIMSTWCPTELLSFDTEIMEVQVNALKIFNYLEPQGRDLIIGRLSSWLLVKMPHDQRPPLTETELVKLDGQIERSWSAESVNTSSW